MRVMPGNWTIVGNVTSFTPSVEELEMDNEIARYERMAADIWEVCSPICYVSLSFTQIILL